MPITDEQLAVEVLKQYESGTDNYNTLLEKSIQIRNELYDLRNQKPKFSILSDHGGQQSYRNAQDFLGATYSLIVMGADQLNQYKRDIELDAVSHYANLLYNTNAFYKLNPFQKIFITISKMDLVDNEITYDPDNLLRNILDLYTSIDSGNPSWTRRVKIFDSDYVTEHSQDYISDLKLFIEHNNIFSSETKRIIAEQRELKKKIRNSLREYTCQDILTFTEELEAINEKYKTNIVRDAVELLNDSERLHEYFDVPSFEEFKNNNFLGVSFSSIDIDDYHPFDSIALDMLKTANVGVNLLGKGAVGKSTLVLKYSLRQEILDDIITLEDARNTLMADDATIQTRFTSINAMSAIPEDLSKAAIIVGIAASQLRA